MGLDMYLYAEKYISQVDYKNVRGEISRSVRLEWQNVMMTADMYHLPSTEYAGGSVSKCVGYWRKANAIHGWFVRELAEGVDKCQRIEVSMADLLRLRDECVRALANRDQAIPGKEETITINGEAQNIAEVILNEWANQSMRTGVQVLDDDPLAPTEGFFFGGTERDEWYYNQLEQTVELINALRACDSDLYSYYYQASW
jgi:hypothetical protein